jgi:hypothetical protein
MHVQIWSENFKVNDDQSVFVLRIAYSGGQRGTLDNFGFHDIS